MTFTLKKNCLLDIDECKDESNTNACHHYAKCENTYGSYNCSCLDGFEGNGTHCQDINECQLAKKIGKLLCNDTGLCVNTIGHYRCDCFDGFQNANDSNQCVGK